MIDQQELGNIINDISYQEEWLFGVWDEAGIPFLQVNFYAPKFEGGPPQLQTGRKWRLSYHMTKSEVVTTALKAVLTAVEHEAREAFKYQGERIFSPHPDVDELARLARTGALEEYRAEVGTKEFIGPGHPTAPKGD